MNFDTSRATTQKNCAKTLTRDTKLTADGKDTKKTTANSRFKKAGVSCFYDSEVLNPSFVHLMKFSAKKHLLSLVFITPSANVDLC